MGQVLGGYVNLGLALFLHPPIFVVFLGVQQIAAVNRTGHYRREIAFQRLKTLWGRRSGGYFAGQPLYLIFYHHCALGEGLPHWTEAGGAFQPDSLRLREITLQSDHFPDAKTDGTGALNRLNLEVNLDVFQGDTTTVGNAYHRDHRSSSPTGHRQVLRRWAAKVRTQVGNAGYERPGAPAAGASANQG